MRIWRISDLKSWIKENDLWVVLALALIGWYIYKWNWQGRDPINLLIVLGIIVSGVSYFLSNVSKLIARDARALVCSLGDNPALAEQAESDADIYRGHFSTEVLKAQKLVDLLAALSSGDFRILHILAEFAGDGMLVEAQGARADVAPLFELCRRKRFLFVYFGGNLPDEIRNAVFGRIGAARVGFEFPLVLTTDRGAEFSSFLDRLLREMGKGMMLGNAWRRLRPQDAGSAPQPAVDPGPKALLRL